MATKSPVRVGVLLQSEIQFLDIAAVDLLHILTPQYLRAARFPEDLVQRIGVNFEFLYIAERTENAGLLGAGARLVITVSRIVDVELFANCNSIMSNIPAQSRGSRSG